MWHIYNTESMVYLWDNFLLGYLHIQPNFMYSAYSGIGRSTFVSIVLYGTYGGLVPFLHILQTTFIFYQKEWHTTSQLFTCFWQFVLNCIKYWYCMNMCYLHAEAHENRLKFLSTIWHICFWQFVSNCKVEWPEQVHVLPTWPSPCI